MGLKIREFAVNYQNGGISFDDRAPSFSWKLVSDKKDTVQTSYRLKVSGGGTVYDTGIVSGDKSVYIEYAGNALLPQTEYAAAVEITDNHGDGAAAILFFETGLMGGENFTAEFISADNSGEKLNCFEVFTGFSTNKKIARARAYATALGLYELKINGQPASDTYFNPGWTSYNKTLQYQAYDITPLVKAGDNEVAVTVGKGWYSGYFGFYGNSNNYGDTNACMAEIHIFYEDGSKQIVKTDGDWKARRSYITDSEIYHGETQDFTQENKEVYPVKTVDYDKSKIIAQQCEQCRVTERKKPIKHIITPLGEQVLDFGQNLVGVIELKIKGKKGQTVTLKHAEILTPDGNFYTTNLRRAKCTDIVR